MPALDQYQELLKVPSNADTIKKLNQPERHVLLSFKVYKALLARIEALEQPTQEIVNRLVDARVKEATAELEKTLAKTWNERLATARIRGIRPELVDAVSTR